MKISIENFKSIRKLKDFELKPFNIISGVNSAGKSSFIQFFLLLKQTIDLKAVDNPFHLDGNLYPVREYIDILFNKDNKNKLTCSFEFNKSEIELIGQSEMSIFNIYEDYAVNISFEFDYANNGVFVSFFEILISLPEGKNQKINFNHIDDKNYSIDTNTALFVNYHLWNETFDAKVNFQSLFPDSYEAIEESNGREFVKIEGIKKLFYSFFGNVAYLEPLRELPKDEYFISKKQKSVGTKGEFVAQILEDNAREPTHFFTIIENENGIIYQAETKGLVEAVKYWMCDIFGVAHDIKTEKINDAYRIFLINDTGLKTSIKHVGFGISQLLPIVVQGLRMPEDGTLILEQPEIHLHPKIQSLLYDFLYSLTLQNKKVIVETHSSHFITRMRRRIAEDESNEMDDRINLTFIENNIFRSIELDDYGTLDYYPKDFIEQSNVELRAIVQAQMKKRLKNQ